MIVFWKYDLFPFLLSGETDGKINVNGCVYVPSYGAGGTFKPVHIFSDDVGKQKQEELKNIKIKHNKKIEKIMFKSKNKILELFPVL